jgi:hypothetical protein
MKIKIEDIHCKQSKELTKLEQLEYAIGTGEYSPYECILIVYGDFDSFYKSGDCNIDFNEAFGPKD